MADEQEKQEETEPEAAPVTDTEASAAAPTEGQVEMEKLRGLFREHGQPVLIGLGLALAIFLGIGAYKNYRQSVALRAAQMLAGARSTEQLQQVVNMYPSTASAPIAMLALAGQYYDAGQYDLAQFTYAQFEQKYPKHPMKLSAEIGKAQCLEGSGQLDQALTAFEAFAAANTNHFLTPMARLGRARCLTQLGQYEDARAAYEEFIAAYPDSGWASLAETALLFVDKEMRTVKKGGKPDVILPVAPPPTAAMPPMSSMPATPSAPEALSVEPAAATPAEASQPPLSPAAPSAEEPAR
jgi:predicted negative regulator of RcsB-dependent stress response